MKFTSILLKIRDKYIERKLKGLNEKDRFNLIYRSGYWRGFRGSLSGEGSSFSSTKNIRESLQKFIKDYHILSLADIPCGDFYWMSKMDLSSLQYLGGDIVEEMIQTNNYKYSKDNLDFQKIDLIHDILPTVDCIFIRDCLVHLEDYQVKKVIKNIIKSQSKYLATTIFPNLEENIQSKEIDRWRPLNLTIKPFNLPPPILLLDDRLIDDEGHQYRYIGVWKIKDLLNL